MKVIRTKPKPAPIRPGDEFELFEARIRMHIKVLATWPDHDSQGRTGIYFEYLDDGNGRGANAKGYRPEDEFRAKASRW